MDEALTQLIDEAAQSGMAESKFRLAIVIAIREAFRIIHTAIAKHEGQA